MKRPVSFTTLVNYGESLGLHLLPYKAESLDFIENAFLPMLLVLNENGRSHMVVLKKKKKRRFWILDPDQGERKLKEKELESLYALYFLAVEGFHEKGAGGHPPCDGVYGTAVVGSLLPLFEAPLLLGGFLPYCSFLFPFLPALSIGGAFLISLAAKLLSLSFVSKMRKRYRGNLLESDPKEREERFRKFHDYLALSTSQYPSWLFGAGEIASLIAFSFLIELRLGALLLILGMAFALWSFFLGTRIKKIRREGEEAESRYRKGAGGLEESLDEAFFASKRFGKLLFLKEGCRYLLCVSVAAGFYFAEGKNLSSAALLGFFLLFFLKEVDKLVCFFFGRVEREKTKAYFRLHFPDSKEKQEKEGGRW